MPVATHLLVLQFSPVNVGFESDPNCIRFVLGRGQRLLISCPCILQVNILPVVLYGCETWSVTFREEHRLRTFENRALRRIFGSKRDEVTGG
jgi:hypothetical protein